MYSPNRRKPCDSVLKANEAQTEVQLLVVKNLHYSWKKGSRASRPGAAGSRQIPIQEEEDMASLKSTVKDRKLKFRRNCIGEKTEI